MNLPSITSIRDQEQSKEWNIIYFAMSHDNKLEFDFRKIKKLLLSYYDKIYSH